MSHPGCFIGILTVVHDQLKLDSFTPGPQKNNSTSSTTKTIHACKNPQRNLPFLSDGGWVGWGLRLIMNAGRIQQEHDFSSSIIFHVAPKRLWIMPTAPTIFAGGIMFISWYLRQARIGPIPARRAVQLYVESASNAFLIVAAKASLEVDCRKHMDVTSSSSSRDIQPGLKFFWEEAKFTQEFQVEGQRPSTHDGLSGLAPNAHVECHLATANCPRSLKVGRNT